MMKAVKYKDGGLLFGKANDGEIVIGDGTATKFSFANASFSGANPNFSFTSTETTSLSAVDTTITANSKRYSLASAISETTQFKEYFGSWVSYIDYDSVSPTISTDKRTCDFTLKFKQVKSGYALSSELSRLTTTGLTIRLTLKDGTFGSQSYKVTWK